MMPKFPVPTWFVGAGNMAGAMIDGWKRAGITMDSVTVVRPSGTPIAGMRVQTSYPPVKPHFVMLGFKPQKLDEVVPDLAPKIGADTILVSMLAGTSTASLRARFPDARAIVRVMPNLPVSEGQGVTALYSDDADEDASYLVGALMRALGEAPWCANEDDFSAIGAVAGSGPAYVARFAAALAKGGERLGLDPLLANRIAVQTMIGTGAMAAATAESMADLARRVASPRGTTEQGLAVLDGENGLQQLVDRMLDAAIERGRAMAEEARRG
nr:pyrroline-5-carboxylate reductase [uncultured Sphingomonas sp.]